MDEIDRKLIASLRANARTPVAALAKQVRLSRGAVQNRIDRLIAMAKSSALPCGCAPRRRLSVCARSC
ncbi:MAG: AsnC family transcriptional regulator [Caulobacteraceae bacterium]